MIYIKNSKDEFISEIEEMFDREVREAGMGIRTKVLYDEAIKQNYQYEALADEAMFHLFGTVESFKQAVDLAYHKQKNDLINKINYAICMMAAACRMNGSMKLYPDFNPDDISQIAIEIFENSN